MDCERAKELIERWIAEVGWHGLREQGREGGLGASLTVSEEDHCSESSGTGDDYDALDAHVKTCPACAAEYEEQLRLRGLLSSVCGERPSEQEIKTMWNVIQQGRSAAVAVARKPGLFASVRPFFLHAAAAAAVLVIAFGLGTTRYGRWVVTPYASIPSDGILSNVDSNIMYSLPAEAADASGRGIPTHPDQYRARYRLTETPTAGGKLHSPVTPSGGVGTEAAMMGKTVAGSGSGEVTEQLGKRSSNVGGVADQLKKDEVAGGRGGQPVSIVRRSAPAAAAAPSLPNTDLDESRLALKTHEVDVGEEPSFEVVDLSYPAEGHDAPQESQQRPDPAKGAQPTAALKLIKTGELAVEVPDYAQAVQQIEAIVAKHGGFIADALSDEETGGALSGRIVIRVAPEQFEAVFAALKAVGRVESENAKAADVTAEYVDLEARIKSLQITEERLHDLVKNKTIIDKISALLEVERELGRVRSQIEQLQGQFRVMADRIALSTITMTVREPARTVPAASLSVEVMTLDAAAKSLGEALTAVGGELRSGKTSKRGDGTLMGNYEVRVSLAKFAELLSSIESLGRVEERQVKDRQFSDATAPWASEVKCTLLLVLFEQSRQLPSGMLGIEIDAMDTAMKRLDEMLSFAGAALTSNYTTRQGDGSNVAEVKIRVPAGKFAGLVDALPALGRMTSRNVFGEAGQIAGGAAAVPCELTLSLTEKPREVPAGHMQVEVAQFELARKELSTIIAEANVQVLNSSSNQRTDGTWAGTFRLGIKAAEMENVVGRIEKLGRVNAREISGMGLGDLSRVDPSSLGTIDLMLAEKTAISPGSAQTVGSIRMYMRDGLRGLYTSLGLILYGLTLMAPWLVIIVFWAWIVGKVRARRRSRAALVAPAAQGTET